MVKILYHSTPESNITSILKHGLIPQIGERAKKLEEEKGIFLFPTYTDCENALYNWLGEEFDELEEEIRILQILLPDSFPLLTTAEWERVSVYIIKPKYISIYQ